MARTYRRKAARWEYDWVLRDWDADVPFGCEPPRLDPRSKAGRRALARFHSDNTVTLRSSAPRWYRRVFDHRLRTFNDRMLRRFLADPEFDPVFIARHRHQANWSWW